MHYDSYERHQYCYSRLAQRSPTRLLDVGGTGLGRKFMPATEITSLNIDHSGDVVYEGGDFPFKNNAFEAVISLDTLEHIRKERRRNFIEECIRVAQQYIIIAAPYGSAQHCEAEASFCEYLNRVQRPNRWLTEHIEYGLPSPADVQNYATLIKANGFHIQTHYAGNYAWQIQNMKLAVQLYQCGIPPRAANLLPFVLGLRIWHPARFTTHPTHYTNRFYLFGTRRVAPN